MRSPDFGTGAGSDVLGSDVTGAPAARRTAAANAAVRRRILAPRRPLLASDLLDRGLGLLLDARAFGHVVLLGLGERLRIPFVQELLAPGLPEDLQLRELRLRLRANLGDPPLLIVGERDLSALDPLLLVAGAELLHRQLVRRLETVAHALILSRDGQCARIERTALRRRFRRIHACRDPP